MTSLRQISQDGLWTNNAALVQVLGLCPLLAVTNSFINGLGSYVPPTRLGYDLRIGSLDVRQFDDIEETIRSFI